MADRLYADEERPSLLFLIVDALAFWVRSPSLFWIAALPIAGLGAAGAYWIEVDRQFVEYHRHWSWNFLFALIYAMFLDRWIKASLLDGATPCDEVDNLRRSIVSPRYLLGAILLLALTQAAPVNIALAVVLGASFVCLFAMMLPALSASAPLPLRQAFALSRPMQAPFFLLIAGSAALSLAAGIGLDWGTRFLPEGTWNAALVAGLQRTIDCLLLAIVGNALAGAFQQMTGWQQPEPDDHPYRDLPRKRRSS